MSFVTENLRPFNYLEDGHLTGISVELLKLVWQTMGEPAQSIQVKTWSEAYYLLQHRPNMVLFLTMRSPRREHLFEWACPITSSNIQLIALNSRKLQVSHLTPNSPLKFAAMKAGVGEQLLLSKGIKDSRIITTDQLDKALQLLVRGRVDAIPSEPEAIMNTANSMGYNVEQFEIVYKLGNLQGCYAFSQGSDAAYLKRFRAALDKVTKSEQYLDLLEKYQLQKKQPKLLSDEP
jgi:polar amino acid transport system substrate-binding protein